MNPLEVATGEHGGRGGGLALHLALAAITGAVCTVVWTAARSGYFWPAWVWMAAGVTVVAHAAAVSVGRLRPGPARSFAAHAAASGLLAATIVVLWLLTSIGSPWPVWPLLGLGAALAVHAAVVIVGPRAAGREAVLAGRVEELTRTRRGAVDAQAVELRRIERDLHDGAQAQLVALSLQLGRAELALASHPGARDLGDVAAMVGVAHQHADSAIAELRRLARGIAPPILTDRGLVEAVGALVRQTGITATIDADVRRRPPPAVEVAAYFVVAEAITNAVKHAGSPDRQATVDIVIAEQGGVLRVCVADDGPGGADPSGAGLRGMAQRVAALDGSLTVTDGPRRGTVVTADLDYGS